MTAVGRDLLRDWYADDGVEFRVRGAARPTTAPQLAVVHGLCAHVHALADTALDLLDEGKVLQSLPIVRAAYEAALKAQWTAQTGDGAAAVMNEDMRQRRSHIRTLEKSVSTVFRETAPKIEAMLGEKRESASSARSFEDICQDLEGVGHDGYAIYRALSHLSHATVLVVDQYLGPADDAAMSLRREPVQPDAPTWTFMTVASLVWAARALDFLDGAHARRNKLRAAALALGISSEFQLSERAVLREARAKRT